MKYVRVKSALAILSLVLSMVAGCWKIKQFSAAGTYVSEHQHNRYLELKSDGTFYLERKAGEGVVGHYEIEGNQITLTFPLVATRGEIEGKTIIFHDGGDERWTKDIPISRRSNVETNEEQVKANEKSAITSLRILHTAEVTYSASWVGFSPDLASLGGAAPCADPQATSSCLIDPALASGTKSGYTFTYTPGTTVPPITSFTIVAVPVSTSTGQRKFFTDESYVIRETTDGSTPTVTSTPLR